MMALGQWRLYWRLPCHVINASRYLDYYILLRFNYLIVGAASMVLIQEVVIEEGSYHRDTIPMHNLTVT